VFCGVTIGSARPCLLPFRGYAAGNLRPVLLVQSRPTSPLMLVHLFETREEAENVDGSVVINLTFRTFTTAPQTSRKSSSAEGIICMILSTRYPCTRALARPAAGLSRARSP